MEIDINKVMGKPSKNIEEAITQKGISQQELLEALYIIKGAIDFPEDKNHNNNRMEVFLKKFSK